MLRSNKEIAFVFISIPGAQRDHTNNGECYFGRGRHSCLGVGSFQLAVARADRGARPGTAALRRRERGAAQAGLGVRLLLQHCGSTFMPDARNIRQTNASNAEASRRGLRSDLPGYCRSEKFQEHFGWSDEPLLKEPLEALDVDSLTLLEFVMAVETAYDVELDEDDVNSCGKCRRSGSARSGCSKWLLK